MTIFKNSTMEKTILQGHAFGDGSDKKIRRMLAGRSTCVSQKKCPLGNFYQRFSPYMQEISV